MAVVVTVSLDEGSPGAGVDDDESSDGSVADTGTICGYVTALALKNTINK